jgi:hypothetical protein
MQMMNCIWNEITHTHTKTNRQSVYFFLPSFKLSKHITSSVFYIDQVRGVCVCVCDRVQYHMLLCYMLIVSTTPEDVQRGGGGGGCDGDSM